MISLFFWLLFCSIFIGAPTFIYMVKNDTLGLFGGLPSLNDLEKPKTDLSSELISADGVSLGKYFRKNRTAITYNELSPELISTLLVTEDYRFKEHSGIDLKALVRAIFGKLTFQFKGGGSTLTMQLAENLYGTNSQNQGAIYTISSLGQIVTKLKEWIIAFQLEQSYTKEEILAMYLNTVEYGSNSFGIQVAAKTFFNKLPSELDYQESASLIGSINKPTRYNPVYNPNDAKAKRTEVLYNLLKYDIIERSLYDSLVQKPLLLNYKVDSQHQGLATYFRSVIRNRLMNWCKENGYDLFNDGLKIYTTLDSRLQKYAETAVTEEMSRLQALFEVHWEDKNPWIDENNQEIKGFLESAIKRTATYKDLQLKFSGTPDSIKYYLEQPKKIKVFSWDGEKDTLLSPLDSMRYYKRFLQAGFLAMDPNSGHIKAWVGGIDYKYFQYDHVKQGKRQPGSTFKPVVYTAAIDNGYSPCYEVVDAAVSYTVPGQIPPVWRPNNSSGKYSGEVMTIRQAMARSVNSITAFIMSKVGPSNVVDYARKLGFTSPLNAVPSLCLGTDDVSLYELVGAYATFVNKGNFTKPEYITKIADKNGNILQYFIPETREALNEQTANLMLHMLKGAIEESGGSGVSLDPWLKENNDIGAKTGTTQNGSDGWFIGVTKDLV
ncbi:MAG: penicillin-binding protein, partial [Flammeovirgaceae bacterium]|nr:penicillin-binding protein [Flammeovirgaceae bacterium]